MALHLGVVARNVGLLLTLRDLRRQLRVPARLRLGLRLQHILLALEILLRMLALLLGDLGNLLGCHAVAWRAGLHDRVLLSLGLELALLL